MAVEVGSAFVTIAPSAKGFAGKLQSELGGPLSKASRSSGEKAGKSLRTGLLGGIRGLAGPIGALFAVSKVVGFFKEANAEARESQKVGALTTQVIKSTGGAAKVTAAQVGTLATAISNKTGIDDEAVQSAANLLLTFTNVRNEVGKNNDVFNQATQAATDMGAALGKSPRASAIQLGKALQDPTKGITALTRSGVAFTAQQKDQIKTMVKSGDTLGAQKVILGEVNREFGGAAAASATAGEKFKTTFKNFEEAVGTALLPILDLALGGLTKFFGFLTAKVGPAVSGLGPLFKPVVDAVKVFFSVLTGGKATNLGPLSKVGEVAKEIRTAFAAAAPVVKAFISQGLDALKTAFGGLVTVLGPVLAQIPGLFKAILPVVKTVGATLLTVFQGALAKIGPIIALVAPIAISLFKQILSAVQKLAPVVGQFIVAVVGLAGTLIKTLLPPIAKLVKLAIAQLVPALKSIFATVTKDVIPALASFAAAIAPVISWLADKLAPIVVNVFRLVVAIIKNAFKIIGGIFRLGTALLKGDWSGAWKAIKQILSAAWAIIKAVVSAAFTGLKLAFRAGVEVLGKVWSTAWGGIKAVASKVFGGARDLIGRILDGVKRKFSAAVDRIGKIWDGLKALAKAPIKFIVDTVLNDGLIAAFNWVSGKVGGPQIGKIGLPKGFARGGWTGPGSRLQPAGIVHADEFVIKKSSRRKLEQTMPGLLDYLNRMGRLPTGRADGGQVGGLPGYSGGGFVKNILGFFLHPISSLKKVVSSLVDGAGAVMDSTFGKIVADVPGKLIGSMVDKLKSAWGSGEPIPGTSGVQRWASLIQRAMVRTGMPNSTFDNWMRQIQTESGGNPFAVQGNIGDVNNRSGDLAKGLLQVIGATFAAYRDPLLPNDRFDPMANAVAAMRYALARYGINGIEGVIGHGHGYAAGTLNARPGFALVGERGPELVRFRGGEQVIPNGGFGGVTINGGVHGYTAREVAEQIDRKARQRDALAFA